MSKRNILNAVIGMAAMESIFTMHNHRGVRVVDSTGDNRGNRKEYQKHLSQYYTPPRSMTEVEQAHYDKHKNLDGFYSLTPQP